MRFLHLVNCFKYKQLVLNFETVPLNHSHLSFWEVVLELLTFLLIIFFNYRKGKPRQNEYTELLSGYESTLFLLNKKCYFLEEECAYLITACYSLTDTNVFRIFCGG